VGFFILIWRWQSPSPVSFSPSAQIFTQSGRRLSVKLEVAQSPQELSHGLMFRSSLPEGVGMLFLFSEEKRHVFWMKNTEIPLDILFIDQNYQIVGIVKNTKPYSETPLEVDTPSRFVLEVNGGFCERYGVQEGDRLQLNNLPKRPP
jgi:hypothetical protein